MQLKKNENLIFPCQAKKLYVGSVKNNLKAKYQKLNYEKNGSQKKKLIKYAEEIGGFPLYLLYNYSEYNFKKDKDYPHKELYGCSLISAHHLAEYPPKAPITVPTSNDIITANKPTKSDIRIPRINLEDIDLPYRSVPNQYFCVLICGLRSFSESLLYKSDILIIFF